MTRTLWKVTATEPWCSGGLSKTRVFVVSAGSALDAEEAAIVAYQTLPGLRLDPQSVRWSAEPAGSGVLLASFPTSRPANPGPLTPVGKDGPR